MQDRLARHFLDAESVLLGKTLQPFTLWHWRTLAALESPLVGGGDITFADLYIGARICALPAFSAIPRFGSFLNQLRHGWTHARYDRFFDDERDTWFDHLAHYQAGPKVLRVGDNQGGGCLKVHSVIYLTTGLMRLGLSDREAWGFTPGLARWYLAGAAENEGRDLNIVTEQHIREALVAGYSIEEMDL